MALLADFEKRYGATTPVFDRSVMPEQDLAPESWPGAQTPAKTE
jgi:hypothetical protein